LEIALTINGEQRSSRARPMTPLLDVLRDEFALTGAKSVCREGFCGACTVLVDGAPTLSCLAPVGTLAGCSVQTVESLAQDGVPSPVQRALEEFDAVQCGMCFPGMVMTLTHFLDQVPRPSREQVREALAGNVCRCTGYEQIIDAVLSLSSSDREVA
jgi:carbon-monoxide dehydrogenase small subunit